MNTFLYGQMLKVNLKGILNYAFGSAFYILLMFWLYPSIANNSKSLNEMLKSMPEGVKNAFNVQSGFDSANGFISGEYYGLILVIILAIFCILISTQLVARLVDQGSMAYLLSTPTTRGKVAFTQAAVLVTGLVLIIAITTAAGFAGNAWFLGSEHALDSGKFVLMNLAAFLLFFAVGGIAFLISSAVNDEKQALAWAGGITFGFYTLDLLGKISSKIEWLRNLSIFSLYRPSDVANGTMQLGTAAVILGIIGLVSFAAGIQLFRKRDLPL